MPHKDPLERKRYFQRHFLKTKYKMTVEKYEELLEGTEYRCPICDLSFLLSTTKVCVDHSNSSGDTRGILCNNCNAGLGFFNDDAERLEKAIKYLRSNID